MTLAIFLISPYVGLAALVLTVKWAYPSLRTSSYRNRLWQLRDELLNEVAAGNLEPSAGAASTVEFLEDLIVTAESMRFKSGLAAFYALRDRRDMPDSVEALDDETALEAAGVEAAFDPTLRQFIIRARDLGVNHLCTATVSALGLSAAASVARHFVVKQGSAVGGRTLGRELVENTRLLAGDRTHDVGKLAQFC